MQPFFELSSNRYRFSYRFSPMLPWLVLGLTRIMKLHETPSTSILLNLFFPFTDITCFSHVFLLNFPKKPLFQKWRWSCDFPPRKDGSSHPPPSGCLGTPLPLPQSLYGRTYADVPTKISRIDRNGVPLAPLKKDKISAWDSKIHILKH